LLLEPELDTPALALTLTLALARILEQQQNNTPNTTIRLVNVEAEANF
jgi:hypothetical protein